MFERFVNALAENMADVLTVTLVVGLIAVAFLFWRARRRHIRQLHRQVTGKVPISGKMKETLAKAFNTDTAEIATIGAVTFVDIAWHYSMADPSIWDHFDGPVANHITDAMQNLDVLKSSLGDQSIPILSEVVHFFQQLEATQVFNDVLDNLFHLGSAGDSAAVVLDAHGDTLVDCLADPTSVACTSVEAKATALDGAGLLQHIPVITMGFATYRAWRRSRKGAGLKRNLEFAAIEVTTRAGGGLLGAKVGGTVGTFIAPGAGTIVGGVAGAVAGAVGGAFLGEGLKQRHVHQTQEKLDASLERLGKTYLQDPVHFRRVTEVFVEQERTYIENLRQTRRRLRRYAMPWRLIWPDQKLILLRETVRMAEERLGEIRQGTIDAMERLDYMRESQQHRRMGIMLWSNPALCQQVGCEGKLLGAVENANDRFRYEIVQLGRQMSEATA